MHPHRVIKQVNYSNQPIVFPEFIAAEYRSAKDMSCFPRICFKGFRSEWTDRIMLTAICCISFFFYERFSLPGFRFIILA